ncbi:hypothetical protein [Cryobacterium sp. Y29]|uniref:hypothetical protein n=1 Tax=Cryobacterium sp. Y29 TaxID=2048285 RepID=UPI000CE3F030|nr:hypothetical protein [Cryobacterium sp. Y29]
MTGDRSFGHLEGLPLKSLEIRDQFAVVLDEHRTVVNVEFVEPLGDGVAILRRCGVEIYSGDIPEVELENS